MSLKCCNKNVQIIEEIDLLDTTNQTHRFLVIGRCKNPNCGALKAQMIYYDELKKAFTYENIKGKNLAEKIKTLRNNPKLKIIDLNELKGSFNNCHWIYGSTRLNNGYIEDWAIDFNGTRTLVRKKELGNTQTNCITTCN